MALAYQQQGSKLVSSGDYNPDRSGDGFSVSISGDGLTMASGAPAHGSDGNGLVTVYVRDDDVWSEEQIIASPLGGVSDSFGYSVALSDDGDTLVIGSAGAYGTGPPDATFPGTAFVYLRTAGVFAQQDELVCGGTDRALVGNAVAVSDDGDTAAVGGYHDGSTSASTPGHDEVGAVWVFTRTAGVWTLDDKLIGTYSGNANGTSRQGNSVAISRDGTTVAFTGPLEPGGGRAWLWFNDGTGWAEQDYASGFGAIALSGDGDMAAHGIDGATVDILQRVAGAWVYVDTLAPSDTEGDAAVGVDFSTISLSSDGSTAVIGGYGDAAFLGAFWVFHDDVGGWAQQGSKYTPDDWDIDPNPFAAETRPAQVWFGFSVDMSSDGAFIAAGGWLDNNVGTSLPANYGVGASWVFASGRTVLAASPGSYAVTGSAAALRLRGELVVSLAGVRIPRI